MRRALTKEEQTPVAKVVATVVMTFAATATAAATATGAAAATGATVTTEKSRRRSLSLLRWRGWPQMVWSMVLFP